MSGWNYKSQDAKVRHIGPMAQDFAAAFGIGEDDTHISSVDADGVALASIKALHELVVSQQKINASQAKLIRSLQLRIEKLEAN